jgi:hypothetical protein
VNGAVHQGCFGVVVLMLPASAAFGMAHALVMRSHIRIDILQKFFNIDTQ